MESKKDGDSASGGSDAESDGDAEPVVSEFEGAADMMESKTRSHASSPSFMLYDATESKADAPNAKRVSAIKVSGPATKVTSGDGNGTSSFRSNGHGMEMVINMHTVAADSNADTSSADNVDQT